MFAKQNYNDMKYFYGFTATITVIGLAVMLDLLTRLALENVVNWGFLGEDISRALIAVSTFCLGWVFGAKLIKYIYEDLKK